MASISLQSPEKKLSRNAGISEMNKAQLKRSQFYSKTKNYHRKNIEKGPCNKGL